MTRCRTDFRHQYGIFGGELQTSFTRNATRAGSEEGRLFSQASKFLSQNQIEETQSIDIHDALNTQKFAMHYRAISNTGSHFEVFERESLL